MAISNKPTDVFYMLLSDGTWRT